MSTDKTLAAAMAALADSTDAEEREIAAAFYKRREGLTPDQLATLNAADEAKYQAMSKKFRERDARTADAEKDLAEAERQLRKAEEAASQARHVRDSDAAQAQKAADETIGHVQARYEKAMSGIPLEAARTVVDKARQALADATKIPA